ncbi:MAG: apolipoprotein N-acyltransferase [Spirochaetes bacterium]|nr:apolipoprotein N-acyltransferase [Spirochaetota bacterium]
MSLAVFSALLYLLSFPVSSFNCSPWPLIFIALVPFFIYLEKTRSLLHVAAAGALFGALVSVGMAYWIFNAMVWEYGLPVISTIIFMLFGLMLPHALMYGVYGLAYRFLRGTITGPRGLIMFYAIMVPSLWIFIDFSRELIPVTVPWGPVGYAVQPCNLFMQMADITGLHGVTFLVVMINSITRYLCSDVDWNTIRQIESFSAALRGAFKYMARNRAAFSLLLCGILVPLAYGAIRLPAVRQMIERERSAGKEIAAIIVQPNFSQDERWKDSGFMDRVNVCMGLTGRCGGLKKDSTGESEKWSGGAPKHGGFVVWPETVLNTEGMVDTGLFSFIQSRLDDGHILVAGGVRREIGSSGVYNSAYIVSRAEGVTFYDKNILLPYSETAPFGQLFGKYYTAPSEFLPGRTPSAARTDEGIIGLSICFEAVYPWYVRRSVRDGARVLVNISNDGWFGRTSEPGMHLRHASVRAVETRRFMVRASNNGYSAVISPTGEIVRRSGLFTRECIRDDIVMPGSKTIYTLLGDWIIYAAAGVLGATLAGFIIKK